MGLVKSLARSSRSGGGPNFDEDVATRDRVTRLSDSRSAGLASASADFHGQACAGSDQLMRITRSPHL